MWTYGYRKLSELKRLLSVWLGEMLLGGDAGYIVWPVVRVKVQEGIDSL